MSPKRMTGKQLAALRAQRGETGDEFGVYLAKIADEDRPYSRQEVNAWERGRRLVPMAIELALMKAKG